MEFLSDYGYWGLFLSSFSAATILPLSSELVLGSLLAHGFDPCMSVGVATIGNVLGSVTNYGLGLLGSRVVFLKLFKMSDQKIKIAQCRFEKYGMFALLFAWVPVVGDPLTVVAGMLKINFVLFVVLVGIGKCLRYIFIAWAMAAI